MVNLQLHIDGKLNPRHPDRGAGTRGHMRPGRGRILRFKVLGPPPQADQSVNITESGTALIPNPCSAYDRAAAHVRL